MSLENTQTGLVLPLLLKMTDMYSKQYEGSHGTSETNWLSIEQEGFKLNPGEHGTGIYFWENNCYAKELAFAWYKMAKDRGEYSKHTKQKCAVIWAKLNIDDDLIFDFSDKTYRDQFLELIKRTNANNDRKEAYKVFDEFTDRLEKKMGAKIKLVITQVFPPKKYNSFPRQIVGMAYCYVVKDADCISIKSVDILDELGINSL